MTTQAARLSKLHAVIASLERDGLSSREAQAHFLGDVVTPRRLQTVLDGGYINTLFAAHVEHVLSKPRGWMSESTDGRACDIERLYGELIIRRYLSRRVSVREG